MAVAELKNVSKRFGDVGLAAVNEFNLTTRDRAEPADALAG